MITGAWSSPDAGSAFQTPPALYTILFLNVKRFCCFSYFPTILTAFFPLENAVKYTYILMLVILQCITLFFFIVCFMPWEIIPPPTSDRPGGYRRRYEHGRPLQISRPGYTASDMPADMIGRSLQAAAAPGYLIKAAPLICVYSIRYMYIWEIIPPTASEHWTAPGDTARRHDRPIPCKLDPLPDISSRPPPCSSVYVV